MVATCFNMLRNIGDWTRMKDEGSLNKLFSVLHTVTVDLCFTEISSWITFYWTMKVMSKFATSE